MAQDKASLNLPVSDVSDNNTRPSTTNEIDNNNNQEGNQVTALNETNEVHTQEPEPNDSKVNDHIETMASSSETSHKRTWSFWSSYKSDDNKPTSALSNRNNNNLDKNLTPSVSRERSTVAPDIQMQPTEGKPGPAAPKYGNPLANTYIPYDADINEYSNINILSPPNIDNSGNNEQEQNQEPNIVVPGFDILPKKSLWNSIHDMIGSRNTNPQKYVYRVDAPSKML